MRMAESILTQTNSPLGRDAGDRYNVSMVKLALLARIVARPGKEEEVAALLAGALALAEAERTTVTWFAFRMSKTEFGVFDAFADEAGRQNHLEGPIAQALMTKAPELLAEPLRIDPLDLVAAKLPARQSRP